MKTVLFVLVLAGSFTHLLASNLTFEWDAAPVEFGVESYNVYERTDATTLVLLGNVTTTDFTVQNVNPGFHRYEVTLVNLWGESLAYAVGETPQVFPSPMVPGKLKFRVVNVQASTDMDKWRDVANVPVEETSRIFYRLTFNN